MNDVSVHGKLNVRVYCINVRGYCINIIKKLFCFKAVVKNRKNIISIYSIGGWWSPLKRHVVLFL